MFCAIAVLLLLAAYLSYVGRLVWVACGQRWQKPQDLQKTQDSTAGTGRSFTAVFPDDRGDPDCELLWCTQVPALELLQFAGPEGLSLAEMTGVYHEFSRSYPELCDGLSFADWLACLQQADIAVPHGGAVSITEKGSLLLEELRRIPLRMDGEAKAKPPDPGAYGKTTQAWRVAMKTDSLRGHTAMQVEIARLRHIEAKVDRDMRKAIVSRIHELEIRLQGARAIAKADQPRR